jgi:hypothetical protein
MVEKIAVRASKRWVATPIIASAGQVLHFSTAGVWWDAIVPCGAEGYPAPLFYAADLPPRIPDEGRYFRLMGRIVPGGQQPILDDLAATFRIGANSAHEVMDTGRLFVFANDHARAYWNNWGQITLAIDILEGA